MNIEKAFVGIEPANAFLGVTSNNISHQTIYHSKTKDYLHDCESEYNLCVRPVLVFSHMIVDWCAQVFHEVDMEKPHERNLDKTKSAIKNKYKRHRNVEQWSVKLQECKCYKYSDGSGTGIAHKQSAWGGVKPEIAQYTHNHYKDSMPVVRLKIKSLKKHINCGKCDN